MIYANAETGQDIARLLRSAQEPIVITAPRQSGKTTTLLKFAERSNPYGKFIVVCRDSESQKQIIRRHWEIVNPSQVDLVANRLLGEPLVKPIGDVMPPLMITPSNVSLLRGQTRPIFCDEWNQIGEDAQRSIIETGMLIAAVTS